MELSPYTPGYAIDSPNDSSVRDELHITMCSASPSLEFRAHNLIFLMIVLFRDAQNTKNLKA